ncbi:MAG: M6 family metalloprotease domain-containing protein [Chitinispirillaceae bacterium]|nr:M6 family metalloprotease domain-containing protein [Chitinispirillaceae bacterium]
MYLNTIRSALLCIVALLVSPLSALIVWDGKIVPAWPEDYLAGLRKTARSSAAPQSGFGFYTRPKDTTYGLTMIVDFSDQQAAFPAEQINDWLNMPGFTMGNTKGSVRDYYYEISNGNFLLVNDVVGYYRAKNPKSYYESGSGYSRATELVNEVIANFDPTVDFSKYDNDGNGTTEAISIVYAGSGQTWGQGLWPHSGYINQTKDGVRLGSYNMCDMGSSLGIYVFCHECGHMIFGWPDLYWFGDYCIMGNRMSDVNPVPVNDFFRADQGWIPTVDLTGDMNARYAVRPNGTGYRYVNPSNDKQMYYWTNVQNTGRYASLRGKGILLYRYDGGIRGNTSGTSRCLYVVEADGNNAMAADQWPSPGSAAKDFFYSGNNTEFSSATNPAAAWGLKIYDISTVSDTMQFSVGTGVVATHQPAGAFPSIAVNSPMLPIFDLLGRNLTIPPINNIADYTPYRNRMIIIRQPADGRRQLYIH